MSKNWVRDYFSFTKKERIAVLVLIFLTSGIFILPEYLDIQHKSPTAKEIAEFRALAQKLKEATSDNLDKTDNEKLIRETKSIGGEVFYFDPNSATPDQWKRLGLSEKTIGTIQNYLSKGGLFRKPEDIRKIYGMNPKHSDRLLPYVKIAKRHNKDDKGEYRSDQQKNIRKHEERKFENSLVDINDADTSEFIRLPGIGNKLATRIINFRERLGGFYSVDQVGETYGLSDSTFRYIRSRLRLGKQDLRKINLNTADAAILKNHPYISWNLANAIVQFRNQHGNFESIDGLLRIALVDENLLRKLSPYFSIY